MARHLLLLLCCLFCLILAISDIRHRRGFFARLMMAFGWLWISLSMMRMLTQSMGALPGVAPALGCAGLVFLGLAFFGYRQPGNAATRVSFLFLVGSASATLAMLGAILFTGWTIHDPAPHARDWVGLLFLDAMLGAPLLASALDATLFPGFIAAALRRQAESVSGVLTPTHGPLALLPMATVHFEVPRSHEEIRKEWAQHTVPLGSSPPYAAPHFRGVIPPDGSFSLLSYGTLHGRRTSAHLDVDLKPHEGGTTVVMHAREGVAYLISALPFLMMVGIGLAVTWSDLWQAGSRHANSIFALEFTSGMGFIVGLGMWLLIHHYDALFLSADRNYLADALGASVVPDPPSVIVALVRLILALGSATLLLLILGLMGFLAVGGLVSHNSTVATIGAASFLGYGLIFGLIGYAARSYYREGWKRDYFTLRQRAQGAP